MPLLPVKAPRGKLDFILGLRHFAIAGEIDFSGLPVEFAAAIEQFSSFPRGKIDAPNAAAYALLLRPGQPVYDLPEDAVVDALEALDGAPLYLAANSDGALVSAALCQRTEGQIRILADWVREGAASEIVGEIHAEAELFAATGRWVEHDVADSAQPYKIPVRRSGWERHRLRWVVPYRHTEEYRNVGLMQAVRLIPQGVAAARRGDEEKGRVAIQQHLVDRRGGRSGLYISAAATWTCRAFAGGYARAVDERGGIVAQPSAGVYRLLMEGLEAFAGLGSGEREEREDQQPVAYSRGGTPYKSVLPDRGLRR